jgi:hypothetical protein
MIIEKVGTRRGMLPPSMMMLGHFSQRSLSSCMVRSSAAFRAAGPTALWSCSTSPVRIAPTIGGVPPDIRSSSLATYMCDTVVTYLTILGRKEGGR